jgi:hypothetical protein
MIEANFRVRKVESRRLGGFFSTEPSEYTHSVAAHTPAAAVRMWCMREKTSRLTWLITILAILFILGDILATLLPAIDASNRHLP